MKDSNSPISARQSSYPSTRFTSQSHGSISSCNFLRFVASGPFCLVMQPLGLQYAYTRIKFREGPTWCSRLRLLSALRLYLHIKFQLDVDVKLRVRYWNKAVIFQKINISNMPLRDSIRHPQWLSSLTKPPFLISYFIWKTRYDLHVLLTQ